MVKKEYDVAVIGAGPGGYVAAIRAAQLGLKTVCIEKRKTLGGTCLNVGCIPSKALLHSTERWVWLKNHAQEESIHCKDISIDFEELMKNKEEIVKNLTMGIPSLFKKHQVEHLEGQAKFTDAHTLEVLNEREKIEVKAEKFIIATGSESISLPFLPFDEERILSSTGALALKEVPKKLLVIGGGVIGVELASVYQRLGSEVILIEMLEGICLTMDHEVSKGLFQLLKKQGLNFLLGAKVQNAKIEQDHVSLDFLHEGKEQNITVDRVLVAIGRRPYTQDLGLEKIGLLLNKGFIKVDKNFQSNLNHIFAIGDVIEGPMLAHKASEEGVVVAEKIAGLSSHINYIAIPNVIYTHPEAASLGLTEKEALELGLNIVVGKAFFKGNARARCNKEVEGFVKVIGMGKEHHIIGMHMLGVQTSELINLGVVALEKRASLLEIANAPIAHPTLSEALKEACGNALNCAIHT